MHRLLFRTLFTTLLTLVLAGTALAQEAKEEKPLVHPLFSDHMVIQRDKRVPIWGWATPGQRINVMFDDKPAGTAITDTSGKWQTKIGPFKASKAGATLRVKAATEQTFLDVLVGDVWICSGQSNMEWSVRMSNDPDNEIAKAKHEQVRLFTVPKKVAFTPQELVEGEWSTCSPETIPNFSAVGYYFGRHLNQELDIPIGLIHTSWGGTIAEAWTSGESLKEKMPDFVDAVATVEKEAKQQETDEELTTRVENWWKENDQGLSETWPAAEFDHSQWKKMEIPNNWEDTSPELEQFDGLIWFRKTFHVPNDWSSADLKLKLGPIDDADTTWVNGQEVGSTNLWNAPREYTIKADVIQPGKNTIAIRVFDGNGGGGIYGKDFPIAVEHPSGKSISLKGDWPYQIAKSLKDMKPFPQRLGNNPNIATVLHNGMLRPLLPFGIRGAIWYQGESNAGRAMQYRRLLPTMISDWRDGFGQDDFPFLIVQLANFMAAQTTPVQSGWAELREAQALTAKNMNKVGLAVITDIGEANDIHPRNKQDVGKRLALQALQIEYEKDIVAAGPTIKDMSIVGSELHIQFENTGDGLETRGDNLTGFAIAEAEGDFVWADAEIRGDEVVLSSEDLAEPIRVRYNWANNPIGNLFNKNGLPAAPFRTDSPRTEQP